MALAIRKVALPSGMARQTWAQVLGIGCTCSVGSGRGYRLPIVLWFGEGAMEVIMTSAGKIELKGGKGNGFSVYQQNTE